MMSELTIKDVIEQAVFLVLSRNGDVDTEDGNFATCGTDEIIRLDMALANLLKLPSDDVSSDDLELINHRVNSLGEPQSDRVSVDNGLPATMVRVLAFDKDGFGWVSARLSSIGKWYLEGDLDENCNVTHWQPLPAAPKGE